MVNSLLKSTFEPFGTRERSFFQPNFTWKEVYGAPNVSWVPKKHLESSRLVLQNLKFLWKNTHTLPTHSSSCGQFPSKMYILSPLGQGKESFKANFHLKGGFWAPKRLLGAKKYFYRALDKFYKIWNFCEKIPIPAQHICLLVAWVLTLVPVLCAGRWLVGEDELIC